MGKFVSPGEIEEKIRRKQNRFLDLLRSYPGISRQECAVRMRISTYNVSKMAQFLLAEGKIVERENETEPSGAGRPSIPLHLKADYAYFAGVDIEADHWRLAIVDFAGNTVATCEEPLGGCVSRSAYISLLERLLKNALSNLAVFWERVAGVWIGAPGLIDYRDGSIIDYGIMPHFRNIPLLKIYRDLCAVPVQVGWNLRNLAVKDARERPDTAEKIILYASVRSGIGTVLSQRGTVLMGGQGRAGEFGLFPVWSSSEGGAPTNLEAVAGLTAMREQMPEVPAEFWQGEPEAIAEVWGNKRTRAEFEKRLCILGQSLAGLVAVLDPDELVVQGLLFQYESPLWKILRDNIQAHLPVPSGTRIIRSNLAPIALAAGAALQAIEHIYPTAFK